MSTPTTTVTIADEIKADGELLLDVRSATDYLDELHEWVEPPAAVRWELARDQPARADHRPAVVLTLEDSPDFGGFSAASDPLSRARTRDPNVRERAVLWAWTRLLQNRSRVLRARTADLVAEAGEPDRE